MNKLYLKSEIWFAVFWILLYVVGTSIAENISRAVGVESSVTFVYLALLSALLIFWLVKNGRTAQYGLCRPTLPGKKCLFYIPLLLIVSVNLWFGFHQNLSPLESAFAVGSMLFVGFAEEIIFRGFLFKAMSKDSLKTAVIVSSLTFGIGHIVNLFNGSGAELLPNLCQICYACAIGFLFVIIFLKTKSLWPCIFTHSAVNALSVFAAELTTAQQIGTALFLIIVPLLYALWFIKIKE
ncbi:MAG: CPBP family intramembrane metalloprotease [Firmicutes bacterium]|nr:CPBP family intramembrane metalloprotease [Bacillota bacterium]